MIKRSCARGTLISVFNKKNSEDIMMKTTQLEFNQLSDLSLPLPLSTSVSFGRDVTTEQAAAYWRMHKAQQAFFELQGGDDSSSMVARFNELNARE